MNNKEVLFELRNLDKFFKVDKNINLKAVDNVNLDIYKGETLGLVGESGSGKTTCGRLCVGLFEPSGGSVLYKGEDIAKFNKNERKEFTKEVQVIFQDPYTSLNPYMKVIDIIGEGIDAHSLINDKEERKNKVIELLKTVGLREEHLELKPGDFSGGQRQRIGIARALAVNPEFIFCDEPISALDVSIQAQIMNLLIDLQKKEGLTYFFISHDLSIVKHMSDRIAVMYLGQIIELAETEELYKSTKHPYTKALLSAIPIPDPDIERNRKKIMLEGEVTSVLGLKNQCRFYDRCDKRMSICKESKPELKEVRKEHFVACHLYD